jgi:glycosyltransferase involved in cell wall biosynthesis
MKEKLNILFICNKSPWPPREGGPIAMFNLIDGLTSAGHKAKVLAVNTNKYTVDLNEIPKEIKSKTGIELVYIDLSVKLLPALRNMILNKSYHVERFKSTDFEQKLIEILQENEFDIVQFELVYMSPYIETIRKYSKAKIVLRAHNIEHLIWQRIAEGTKNIIKKFYVNLLVNTLQNYELSILDKYDGIIPITSPDAEFFKAHSSKPVLPVSFGINFEKFKISNSQEIENAVFHIGAMNWMPNNEGIKWFLKEVLPLLNKHLPDIKIYLAGREMPYWLKNLKIENVVVAGEVPDALEFISSKSISIAPLLSGSGIRVKIIESMAMGKAVVSTSIGAEGINYTDGENILIADSPEDFCEAIATLYKNPEKANKLGNNAQKLVTEYHSTTKIIEELVSFYRRIL